MVRILCLLALAAAENATRGLKVRSGVTILHVSDTHSLHHAIRDLPSADIFIHSGAREVFGYSYGYGYNYIITIINIITTVVF